MKKRRIFTLIIAVIFVLSLGVLGTACEADPDDPVDTDDPVDVDDPTDPPDDDEEQVELLMPFWGFDDEELQEVREEHEEEGYDFDAGEYMPGEGHALRVMDYIRENYPNYDVEYVDWGWAETLDQSIRAAVAAGDPPALVAGEIAVPSYVLEGILSPLPDDIIDSVYEAFLVTDPEGTPYAVTTTSAAFHLFYNIDILEEFGYTEDDVPETWDEWREISADITERGDGEYWGGGIPSFPHYGGSLRATPFLRQMGVDWGESDSIEMLSDPAVIETLEYIREMNQFLPEGVGNAVDESSLWNLWDDGDGNGNIAFIIDGTFRGSDNARSGINAGVADLPLPEGGVEGNCAVGAVLGGVPADHPHQEEAFDLLRAVISPEAAVGVANAYRVMPHREALDDDALFEDKDETLLAARELYRSGQPLDGLVIFERNSASIWEVINQQVLSMVTMTDDPIDEIVENAQIEIRSLLEG